MKKKFKLNNHANGFNDNSLELKKKGKGNEVSPNTDSVKNTVKDVPFFKLFKFATKMDLLSLMLGISMSLVSGAMTPVLFILFGDVTGALVDFQMFITGEDADDPTKLADAEEKLMETVTDYLIYNCALGAGIILLSYLSVLLITMPAIRQISKIRSLYMSSVLNKDISWYDTNQTGDFSSRITEDLRKIEDAVGDKISTFSYYMAIFVSGLIAGLIYGWELALICLIYCPVSMVAVGFISWISNKLVRAEVEAYAKAASIAEEIISAIRTVFAFDGHQKESTRYRNSLMVARSNNIRKGFFTALNNGFMWLFVFLSYALSFYYGVSLVLEQRDWPEDERIYTPANMITVFFNILVATWNFSQCVPFFQIFASGKAAAAQIFAVIDEPPTINMSKRSGIKPAALTGDIKFESIHFEYPSRSDVRILRGLCLEIRAGETVALVGNSGCGKSTCIQLIQRFYDPREGQVLIDGVDMRAYNLKWLRNQIGVVGQEPVLFATTIEENIRYGNQQATMEEIENAARKSNAHSFIEKLPAGYQTLVGERGAQLSGGQKQRIAIARALVRNPKILLLDEATSALDTHSESLVQEALDNASKECTTIIVAHRLSTIRGADRIVVISEGVVIEDGNHEDLMSKKGAYFNLVTAQVTDEPNLESHEKGDELVHEFKMHDDKMLNEVQHSTIDDTNEVKLKYGTSRILWEILKINKPEMWLIVLGCLGAIVQGASIPIYAVIYGDVVGVLSNPDDNYVREEGNKFSLYFCIIGVACGIAAFLQTYLLIVSGEKLTLRVRTKMFDTIIHQEIGWFDLPEHGVGAICTSLASDAAGIQGAAGQPIGTALTSLSSLGIAIIISFIYEWRLTLVTMAFVPLIFLSIYFEAVIVNSNGSGENNSIENSAKYAIEAIGNIRTVASLGVEKMFHVKYLELLAPHYKRTQRGAHMRGIVLGVARSLMFFCYAVVTYYGGTLIRDEHMDFALMYKVNEALVAGAWAMGTAVAFTPNFQKGVAASEKLLRLLARQPTISDGKGLSPSTMTNLNVHYKHINFAYPTRPEVPVLQGLNLNVLHGKTVALVGPSGCGKSTIVQLLERFYDPRSGAVMLGDCDVKDMKLTSLRANLGIVSQEPNLFDRTIMENIAYGDNHRLVTTDEVISAAQKANIHNFIVSLPLGYETRLGDKGTQLSGGQKQRVAIARALIRNPAILLLDEATSALDTESEKIVQEALDKAKSGRTCITIAHRLLTIQDADVICVINKGVVEEMGTHSELLEKAGIYHKLYNLQMGRNN